MVHVMRRTYACGCVIGSIEHSSGDFWLKDREVKVKRDCYKHLHPERWVLIRKKDAGGCNYSEWENICAPNV